MDPTQYGSGTNPQYPPQQPSEGYPYQPAGGYTQPDGTPPAGAYQPTPGYPPQGDQGQYGQYGQQPYPPSPAYPPQQPYGAPSAPAYPYAPPAPMPVSTNGFSIASLICSVLGISLLGVIFGHVALSQIKNSNGMQGGRGLAIAGLIIGYIELALAILFVVFIVLIGAFAASNPGAFPTATP